MAWSAVRRGSRSADHGRSVCSATKRWIGCWWLICSDAAGAGWHGGLGVRPLPGALFRSVRVAVAGAGRRHPTVNDVYREVINIGRHNVPMVDYHVNLRGGLTLEGALQKSRRDGIEYGIVGSDARSMQHQPMFLGLQGRAVSRHTAALFDYILSDSVGWTDERDMDARVARAVDALEREPMDIWASPTYLPPPLAKDYNTLWTEQRMKKVIDAAARNQVAIEISNRYRIPSAAFIRAAKAGGCKFCFGSNNAGASDLGRCEYGIEMLNECKLDWRDFFVPGAWTARVVERRGSLLAG